MEELMFNPHPRTITWQRLEALRMKKLGLKFEKFSRHFNLARQSQMSVRSNPRYEGAMVTRSLDPDTGVGHGVIDSAYQTTTGTTASKIFVTSGKGTQKSNSIAPFATVGKPTCGVFFSRGTDHRKQKFGIAPTNLVKWRSASHTAKAS
eukprot:GHVU01166486.1.p1 GENE.GHVU01166486.1~~GHVU01166486.1.p1  ORF type:complete len:149 (+),score=2.46 GHVU01166486.1:260-706(+)